MRYSTIAGVLIAWTVAACGGAARVADGQSGEGARRSAPPSLDAVPAHGAASSPVAPLEPFEEAYERYDYVEAIALVEPHRDDALANLATDPEQLRRMTVLAGSYFEMGRASDALTLLDAVDERLRASGATIPEVARIEIDSIRANALILRGDYAGALVIFDAIPPYPSSPEDAPLQAAMNQDVRGYILALLDDAEACRAAHARGDELEPIRRLQPEIAQADPDFLVWLSARNSLAWSLWLIGRAHEGLALVEPIMRMVEGDPRIHIRYRANFLNTIGVLLFATGRFEDSVAVHRRELQMLAAWYQEADPRRASTLLWLARAETAAGESNEGANHARQALALVQSGRSPTDPELALAHLYLAQALAAAGDRIGARTEAEQAVRLYLVATVPTHRERIEAEAFLRSLP